MTSPLGFIAVANYGMDHHMLNDKRRNLPDVLPKPTGFGRAQELLKTASDTITQVVIIMTFVSFVAGTAIIRLYLSNYTVIISPYETISPMTFQFFMIIFLSILGTIIVFILAPLGADFAVRPETQQSLPNLFARRRNVAPNLKPKTVLATQSRSDMLIKDFRFSAFIEDYGLFYLPTLVMCLVVPVESFLKIPSKSATAPLPWLVPVTLLLSAYLLYRCRLRNRIGKPGTIFDFLYLNFMMVIWVLSVQVIMLYMVEQEVGQSSDLVIAFTTALVAVVAMGIHMVLSWLKFAIRALLAGAWVVACILFYYPGYSAIGAVALQEAQLGGGIPISYTGIGSSSTVPHQQTAGCLVLATSTYVLIGDLESKKCPSLARIAGTLPQTGTRSVQALSRNDISIASPSNAP